MKKRVEKFINNPKKGLFILAAPMLMGMLVQTLYNIVDTAFVGRLGAESIAALTFAFPVFFIFIALNAGLGAGVSSRISRYMGELNKKQAENTAMHGIIISILLSVLIFSIGSTFIRPLFLLLGAEANVLELAISYMKIIFMGGIFFMLVAMFNAIFSSQGDPKTAMKIMVSALVLNIILDPIFIYVLGYGVKGAAIATVIAFIFGFMLSLFYIKTKSILAIKLSSFRFSKRISKQIIQVGIPATLMMLTTSIAFMFINKILAGFGVDYIAAVGLSFRLESLAIMPSVALSLSMLTLTGMLYGSKKYNLLKSTSYYGIKIGVLISVCVGIILFFFPHAFLRIFTSDEKLLLLGSSYIRIMVFSYPMGSVALIIGRILQGTGVGLPSLIINLFRTLLVPIPLIYLFVFKLGYSYLSIPVALIIGGIVAALIAVVWIKIRLKKLHIEVD